MRAKGKQVGLCWQQGVLSPPHPLSLRIRGFSGLGPVPGLPGSLTPPRLPFCSARAPLSRQEAPS